MALDIVFYVIIPLREEITLIELALTSKSGQTLEGLVSMRRVLSELRRSSESARAGRISSFTHY
jgi:hypothetical protein